MLSGRTDRRGLEIPRLASTAAWVLIVAGVELTTRAVSVGVVRFRESFRELRSSGATIHVPTEQFWIGAALILIALSFLVFSWIRRLGHRTLADGACPMCGQNTKRIRRTSFQRFVAPLLGSHVSRRRCDHCGWVGLSKDS